MELVDVHRKMREEYGEIVFLPGVLGTRDMVRLDKSYLLVDLICFYNRFSHLIQTILRWYIVQKVFGPSDWEWSVFNISVKTLDQKCLKE